MNDQWAIYLLKFSLLLLVFLGLSIGIAAVISWFLDKRGDNEL